MRRCSVPVLLALALAACGDDDPDPAAAACTDKAAILAATEGRGDVRIQDCLVAEADAGELQRVGAALLAAATDLSDRARAERGGRARDRLDRLLRAAREGERRTGGIHHDLLRRLEQEADAAGR